MARFEMTPDAPFSASWPVEERVTAFLRAVYGWMCGGLAITAVTASVHCVLAGVRRRRRHEPAPLLGLDDRAVGYCVRAVGSRPATRGVHGGAVVHRLFGADRHHDFVRAARVHRRIRCHDVRHHRRDVWRDGGVRHTTRRSLAGFGQFLFMGLIGVVLASLSSASSGTATDCSS